MKRKVKIFGERNTGTNYVEQLLRKNYPVRIVRDRGPISLKNLYKELGDLEGMPRIIMQEHLLDVDTRKMKESDFGWKHTVPNIEFIRTASNVSKTYFVCVVKYPYSFITSLFNRPRNDQLERRTDLRKFVESPWKLTARDSIPMHFLESPVQLWNYKVGSYLRLKDSVPNCMIVKYEDIIADVGSFFDSTDRFLGLNGTRNNVLESATMGEKVMTFDMYARKYGSFDPATLGRRVVRSINQFLDSDIVEKAGYKIFEI